MSGNLLFMSKSFYFFIVWLGLLTAVSGCQSPALPELTAAEIVQNAAQRMNELAGFSFDISREGAPAYLDPDEILSFRRATGSYVAPNKAAATVRIIGPGLITDIDVISIAETQWQTNVATGAWEELPPNWGFNPAVLFDAEVGLPIILTTDLQNLQVTEPEQLADREDSDQTLYHLTGTVAGDRLYQMSGTLIGPETVMVELWVMPETFELVRVSITEPVPGSEEDSLWQLNFSDFGQTVPIEPPLSE